MKTLSSDDIQLAMQRAALIGVMLSCMASQALAGGDLTPVQSTLDQLIELFTGTLGQHWPSSPLLVAVFWLGQAA